MSQDTNLDTATKLTRTEFAVIRAYAQGMRPIDIANRYLADPDEDEHLSESQAIQRILALRDRLVQFALQHGRPEIAEMFEALRARSDIGMTRRVDAVSALEQLGQGYPQPHHEVSLWFKPSLARRLITANIYRIEDLTSLANRRGSSWWRAVPRVGAKSAEVITRWLVGQRPIMGSGALNPYVLPPTVHARREALAPQPLGPSMPYPVPLELMLMPVQNTDFDRILADELLFVRNWLQNRTLHTHNSYRREAERILLWTTLRKKSLSTLDADDIASYRDFLTNPEPVSFWCGPSSARDRAHWRPLEGPLHGSSVAASLRVVRTLLHALAQTSRRKAAPCIPRLLNNMANACRAYHHPDIDIFLAWLSKGSCTPRHRVGLAAALIMHNAGVPLSELATLKCCSLHDGANGILLQRPNSRHHLVCLDSDVHRALQAHWADRGWSNVIPPAQAALLAPMARPATTRSQNKQLSGHAGGYSASGLDQLLRSLWRRFCEQRGVPSEGFTPGQLRTRASRA